jgi:enoyl-CoA hydratase/carnithine racemase
MLTYRIEDNIAIATFENGKYNAITLETLKNLEQLVKNANEDPSLKGIVFTGQGKTFCSGFDLSIFLGFKDPDDAISFFRFAEEVLIGLFTCTKPVVCAINGAAVAGGFIFSMASDYRIVKNHPKIKLGMPEIKMGLALTPGQTEIMRFGLDSNRLFREVMYNGELFDVDSAKEKGLVDEVVEEQMLIARAKDVITTWTDNPGQAFGILKTYYRKPFADRVRERRKEQDWHENLVKLVFAQETRQALERAQSMMAG